MDSPRCIRSKAVLISSRGMVCVIIESTSILPSMYQSTILGTSVRPLAPPKADPLHDLPAPSWHGRAETAPPARVPPLPPPQAAPLHAPPVASWHGRVEISSPEPATPMMTDGPQPLWAHSSAWRLTFTWPMRPQGEA